MRRPSPDIRSMTVKAIAEAVLRQRVSLEQAMAELERRQREHGSIDHVEAGR